MLRIFVSSSFSGCGCILKLVLESGCCPSHLSDLLRACSGSLAALRDGADLLADLADGAVNLGGLLPVLLIKELALFVLLPVLLPGLSGLCLSLVSSNEPALLKPLSVGFHVKRGLSSVCRGL